VCVCVCARVRAFMCINTVCEIIFIYYLYWELLYYFGLEVIFFYQAGTAVPLYTCIQEELLSE
jgi:uncharacterized membrane protein